LPTTSTRCCSANSGAVSRAAGDGPCRACRRVCTNPVHATSSALAAGLSRDVRLRWHVGTRQLTELCIAGRDPLPDVPYPNVVLLPPWRTEQVLIGAGDQLDVTYRCTGLADDGSRPPGRRVRTPVERVRHGAGPAAGDRAPIAPLELNGAAVRLFDVFRGPASTLLLFAGGRAGAAEPAALEALARPVEQRLGGDGRVCVVVPGPDRPPQLAHRRVVLLDRVGSATRSYGRRAEPSTWSGRTPTSGCAR
jgi:hypothetical protein